MAHFFRQLAQLLDEAEWAGVLITILVALLLLSLIILNIVACICAISMRKSLKQIAHPSPESKPKITKTSH